MALIPSEVSIAGVLLPPLFLAAILGTSLAAGSALFLNRYRLSRFFFYPPIVFLAMAVIYTGAIGTFVIPS